MIKIKISYQNSQELEQILQLLSPITKSCKVMKEHGTRYDRAYITIENPEKLQKTSVLENLKT